MLDFDPQNGFICLHAFQNKTFTVHSKSDLNRTEFLYATVLPYSLKTMNNKMPSVTL